MLDKIKKYVIVGLTLALIAAGVMLYVREMGYRQRIVELHNEIALSSKTVEVHKNAYEKKAAELRDLSELLKTFEAGRESDAETIRKLRKEIDARDSEILSLSRIAAKWKAAYEAEVAGNQTEDPGNDPDDPSDDRIKVEFEKDFGYIGVKGYTLTNPPLAWVRVQQNRPLLLTLAVTQEKDGRWTTFVTSSEENVGVDIQVSAVNPRVLEKRWYEKISLDAGVQFMNNVYPFAGVSYSFDFGLFTSGGVWAGFEGGGDVGYYISAGYSWSPFERK